MSRRSPSASSPLLALSPEPHQQQGHVVSLLADLKSVERLGHPAEEFGQGVVAAPLKHFVQAGLSEPDAVLAERVGQAVRDRDQGLARTHPKLLLWPRRVLQAAEYGAVPSELPWPALAEMNHRRASPEGPPAGRAPEARAHRGGRRNGGPVPP